MTNAPQGEGNSSGPCREGPPGKPNPEEACDERSGRSDLPHDVTSPLVRRGGVNLQPEVEPQRTKRPPRDSPSEDTRNTTKIEHTSGPARPRVIWYCELFSAGWSAELYRYAA